MAELTDTFGTSSFNLSFHAGEGLVSGYEEDYNNWIPIVYETKICGRSYTVSPEEKACLSVQEISFMFASFRRILQEKRESGSFGRTEIASSDLLYKLTFEHEPENDRIAFSIRTIEAIRTYGAIQGVEMELQMTVEFEAFERFGRELEQELLPILTRYELKLDETDWRRQQEAFVQERMRAVRELAAGGSTIENDILLRELAETDDPRLRNELALALSDLGEEQAVDVLIELVQQRRTQGYRGTLLYALEPLDYARHHKVLIEQLIGGGYEASEQAYTLLENISSTFTESERETYRTRISHKLDLLNRALSLFDPA